MENIKAITHLEDAMETVNSCLVLAAGADNMDAVETMSGLMTAMAEAAAKLYSATNGDKMLEPIIKMLEAMHDRPPVKTAPVSAEEGNALSPFDQR